MMMMVVVVFFRRCRRGEVKKRSDRVEEWKVKRDRKRSSCKRDKRCKGKDRGKEERKVEIQERKWNGKWVNGGMITTAGSRDHRNNRESVSVSVTEGRKLYRVVERRIKSKYCKCNGEWRSRIWRKKRNERKSKMVEIHPRDSHIHFHFQLRGYYSAEIH